MTTTEEILETPELPKPLLSICVITTQSDMDKYGKNFLKNLPKSPDVELIVLLNEPTTGKERVELLKEDVRLKMLNYFYKGHLDFAKLRNKCKEYATGEWIFSMDIDDILLDIYHEELLQTLIDSQNSDTLGIRIGIASSWYNFNDKETIRENVEVVKIFKNLPLLNFYGALHELVEWNIPIEKVMSSTIQLLHIGYDIAEQELIKKMKRNLKGLNKVLLELNENEDNYESKFDHYSKYLTATLDFMNKIKK